MLWMHTLSAIAAGGTLTEDESATLFTSLLRGEAEPAQIAALLGMLQARGVTVDELVGAARAMRHAVEPVPVSEPLRASLVDTCGTGGAPKTFNISTAAALIAAGARSSTGAGRVYIAKHGNRSRTGRGSAEILTKLAVAVDAKPAVQARCLEEAGVCFCFAIHHHPAMRFAAEPRKALGFPTIFNLLGPLTNPAGATRQLLGVYDPNAVPLVGAALARLSADRAIVAHGKDGLDEITTTTKTMIADIRHGVSHPGEIDPTELGIDPPRMEELVADDLDSAAATIHAILAGEPGPRRDIAAINAAAAIVVGGLAQDLSEGYDLAQESIDSGRAAQALKCLASLSHAE